MRACGCGLVPRVGLVDDFNGHDSFGDDAVDEDGGGESGRSAR
jgi:hypothetical protein